MYRFREIAANHPRNLEILVNHEIEPLEESARELAREVQSLITDVLVRASHKPLGPDSAIAAALFFRERPLPTREDVLARAKEHRILRAFSVAQRREGL